MAEHPGPYRGRRNDYRALSEYWAKRSRYYEGVYEGQTQNYIEENEARARAEAERDKLLGGYGELREEYALVSEAIKRLNVDWDEIARSCEDPKCNGDCRWVRVLRENGVIQP